MKNAFGSIAIHSCFECYSCDFWSWFFKYLILYSTWLFYIYLSSLWVIFIYSSPFCYSTRFFYFPHIHWFIQHDINHFFYRYLHKGLPFIFKSSNLYLFMNYSATNTFRIFTNSSPTTDPKHQKIQQVQTHANMYT